MRWGGAVFNRGSFGLFAAEVDGPCFRVSDCAFNVIRQHQGEVSSGSGETESTHILLDRIVVLLQ